MKLPTKPILSIPTENLSQEESSEILFRFAYKLINRILKNYQLTHLKELEEAESIFVLREVISQFENPVLLFSGE